MECWKTMCTACPSSTFVKDWWLVNSISKTNCGTIVPGRDSYCEKLFRYLYSVYCWKRINRIAGFSKLRWPPILWQQQQLSCGTSSVITLSGMVFGLHDPQTLSPDFFLWRFLKEWVYSHKPRSLEDFKHTTEQALAGTYQLILQQVAK